MKFGFELKVIVKCNNYSSIRVALLVKLSIMKEKRINTIAANNVQANPVF